MSASILAVDVDTGELKWHYQVVPGDNWDFDSVQHLILADLTIDGRPRKVIMQANKNAFYYVIDRLTGQFISAQPFSHVTWAKGIDQKTGRPIVNDEAFYGTDADPDLARRRRRAQLVADVVQSDHRPRLHPDVHRTTASPTRPRPTFNPRPGAMTGTVRPAPAPVRPPPPAIGPPPIEGPGGRGALVAWDPVAQQMRWRMPGGGGIGGGTLTTAGNLVFQVLSDGRLVAYSADKGEKLLEIQTGLRSGMGPPITYRLDGKQYVALMGGVGATAGGNAGPGKGDAVFAQAADVRARRQGADAVLESAIVHWQEGTGGWRVSGSRECENHESQ